MLAEHLGVAPSAHKASIWLRKLVCGTPLGGQRPHPIQTVTCALEETPWTLPLGKVGLIPLGPQ